MRVILILTVAAIGLGSCRHNIYSEKMTVINDLLERYYEERLSYFPLEATTIGDERYNDQLPVDIADSYREKLKSFYEKYAQALDSIDEEKLSPDELLSYDTFRREMKMQLEGLTYKDNLMPINQFWSMHLTFPLLGSGHGNQPFKKVKDYDDFLQRIHAFTAYVDTAISNMRRGMQEGIVPPAILMERVLPQLIDIVVDSAGKSIFYDPVKSMPDSFSVQDKSRLTEAYTAAIMNEIVPSYSRLHVFIRDEYLPQCRTTSGISYVPGGREYYDYLARYWTTTSMTPDEIFETGHKEVTRLRNEMEKVMRQTGFKGNLKSFFAYIHTDKKFRPFQEDQEVIDAFRKIEDVMKPQLAVLFNLVPKAKFEVRQTEKFREASASAEYNQSAPDGSRPGIFYVPVPDPKKYNVVGMEDLFLHEAIPGHHYQISIQQENDSLPKFRRFGWYGAYGEGWALYTESLGKELGLYRDPYQYFGSLSEEMHRAIRLVVDVGMHLKGWTREEAIQFSLDNEAQTESDVTAEIERYMAIPGQALAYKIGQLKILELRKKAEVQLGGKFDIRAFHDEVLRDGCLPMDVFERKMNRWIEAQLFAT